MRKSSLSVALQPLQGKPGRDLEQPEPCEPYPGEHELSPSLAIFKSTTERRSVFFT
jgi:hypothetical protein